VPRLVPVRRGRHALQREHGHTAAPRHDPHPRVHGKLASKIADGSARILSATVSRTAQRWFASFTVEVERDAPERHARPGSAVGIDLGVKTLLTGVDDAGRVFEVAGAKPLRSSMRRLRKASRSHSRKVNGSANRRKSAARLARLHARVANVRADALHKATTALAREYETVVVEDLNVTGMVSNRRLARAVSGQGFDREYAVGSGRTDILIRKPYGSHQMQREAIELKAWAPGKADPLKTGLKQLDGYLDRFRLDTGTLIIFDRRPTAPAITERTAFSKETTPSGRTITVLRAWSPVLRPFPCHECGRPGFPRSTRSKGASTSN
jgi:hypothetical protein